MPTVEYLDYSVLTDYGWELDDEDLFVKAEAADLSGEEYGTFETYESEAILVAAERAGYFWPFSCRGGSCANCACKVIEGELTMNEQIALTEEEVEEKGIYLTCISQAATDHVKIVYNVKQVPYLQDRVIEA